MKKIIIILALGMFYHLNLMAQFSYPNCDSSKPISTVMWRQWEKLKPNKLRNYPKRQLFASKEWKREVLNNPSYLTIGPQYLDFNKTTKGYVIPKTQRTLISVPANKNAVKIRFAKTKGRAKTDLIICIQDENGNIQNKIKYQFPSESAPKIKSWTIYDVKGKIISIVLNNHSTTNKFNYTINCK